MTIPEGMLTCRLSIHSIEADGSGRQGFVIFTPNETLASADNDAFIGGATTVQLGAGGSGFVTLIACDDPTVTPVDWKYYVMEYFDGVFNRSYIIQPLSTDDGKDLSDLEFLSL
jgi:hypothetical protein